MADVHPDVLSDRRIRGYPAVVTDKFRLCYGSCIAASVERASLLLERAALPRDQGAAYVERLK
jgi:hypothetical protein